jgi:hypothetical protein
MLAMREPDTPGGFNASMACKPASSSATAEDMIDDEETRPQKTQFIQIRSASEHEGRPKVYFLCPAIHLDSPIGGYDKGEVLSLVITMCDRHARAGAEEDSRYGSKVELMADVAACRYCCKRKEYLFD